MIGSQSSENHVSTNGLNSRMPYTVGRSMATCRAVPAKATPHSVLNPCQAPGRVDARSDRHPTTSSAETTASARTPSGPCVGPRCAAK